jgi:hypothetical protein
MTAISTATSKTNGASSFLAAVIIIGLLARVWALGFGLPHWYHMEEPFYTDVAWNLACNHNTDSPLLQPHTLVLALMMSVARFFQPAAVCGGAGPDSPLLGRLISAAMGTITIWIVYKLGRSLFSMPAGVMGALFLALNFLHVRESHYATPDSTAVLLMTSALWAYVLIAKKGATYGHYALASALTALAIVGRPTAVLLALPFAYAHAYVCFASQRFSLRSLLKAAFSPKVLFSGLILLVTYALVNPQLWVNPVGHLKYWYSFLSLSGRIQYLSDLLPAPLFYLRAIEWGSGLILALLMVIGLIWAIRHRSFGDVLLLSFIIPYWTLAAFSKVYFARYMIPILPVLGILAARFLWEVLPQSRRLVWATALLLILVIQPVESIVRYDYLLTQTDTRTLAKTWIETHIPRGTKIATEWHTAPIEGYDLTAVGFYGLSEKEVESYRQEGYEYLIVSSFIRDFSMASPAEEVRKRAFYSNLANAAELVRAFKPYAGPTAPPYVMDQSLGPITSLDQFERPGPTIEVYRLQ